MNRFVPVNVTSLFCSIYDANLSWDLFNKPFLLKGLAIVLCEEELLVFLLLLLKSIEIISARLGKSFFEELSLKLSFVFPLFICFLLLFFSFSRLELPSSLKLSSDEHFSSNSPFDGVSKIFKSFILSELNFDTFEKLFVLFDFSK